jgi:hypothetical protein
MIRAIFMRLCPAMSRLSDAPPSAYLHADLRRGQSRTAFPSDTTSKRRFTGLSRCEPSADTVD